METINNYISTLTPDQFIVGFLAVEIGIITILNIVVYLILPMFNKNEVRT